MGIASRNGEAFKSCTPYGRDKTYGYERKPWAEKVKGRRVAAPALMESKPRLNSQGA